MRTTLEREEKKKKRKRRNLPHSQRPGLLGCLGDGGCGPGTGAPAHPRGDEHQVRAGDGPRDVGRRLLRGGRAQTRVPARAEPASELGSQLELVEAGGGLQSLGIGVDGPELDALGGRRRGRVEGGVFFGEKEGVVREREREVEEEVVVAVVEVVCFFEFRRQGFRSFAIDVLMLSFFFFSLSLSLSLFSLSLTCRPELTMRLTALPPPPPTPMTLMRASPPGREWRALEGTN